MNDLVTRSNTKATKTDLVFQNLDSTSSMNFLVAQSNAEATNADLLSDRARPGLVANRKRETKVKNKFVE